MSKKMDIWQGDITTLEVDCIVNAANKSLLGGGGVDGAIHRAAGPELLEATKALGGAETGEAKITNGFDLPATFVIHTVGPVYNDGESGEDMYLRNCYKNALELADEYKVDSIAFSAISTGVYGYPIKEATKIAVETVTNVLKDLDYVSKVIFVVFDDSLRKVYEETFEDLAI